MYRLVLGCSTIEYTIVDIISTQIILILYFMRFGGYLIDIGELRINDYHNTNELLLFIIS